MNVLDITVQFNDIAYISDAIGLVLLFHCFIKYFVCCKKERTELDISIYRKQSTITVCVL
jgi:hypothetical protein